MGYYRKAKGNELQMCYYGDPVLKRQSVDLVEITEEIRNFAERMIVTMRAHEGIGLAAPQVGRNINLITLEIFPPHPEDPQPTSPGEMALLPRMPMALVNPKISGFSSQTSVYDEGCLSIPKITGEVERPEYLELTATDINGQPVNYRCGGMLARCIQHEIDHLNGILFTELVSDEHFKRIESKLKKMQRDTEKRLKK